MNSRLSSSFLPISVALFVFAAVIVLAAADNGDGRPGCKTDEELAPNPKWRHNFDPSAFWLCQELGVAAERVQCETVMEEGSEKRAFNVVTRECDTWENWTWSETSAPLSSP